MTRGVRAPQIHGRHMRLLQYVARLLLQELRTHTSIVTHCERSRSQPRTYAVFASMTHKPCDRQQLRCEAQSAKFETSIDERAPWTAQLRVAHHAPEDCSAAVLLRHQLGGQRTDCHLRTQTADEAGRRDVSEV